MGFRGRGVSNPPRNGGWAAEGYRRRRWLLFGLICMLVQKPISSRAEPTSTPTAFLLGADISVLPQVEKRGGIFRDAGAPGDAIAIFERDGWNCFRLRLFVNPNGRGAVVNDLSYTCRLARRIKQTGASLILDIHYSDTWADPQHQITPRQWAKLSFPELQRRLEQYTADVLTEMKSAGALPDIVQVGNEITGGMCWPMGQVQVPLSTVKVYEGTVQPVTPPQPYDDARQWDQLASLLKAGVRGVREATSPSDHVRILIHIDCAGDWPVTRWFFDHLQQHDVQYDVIGQSYYPHWHGTLADVQNNLAQTARRYRKDILIVETSYPWTDRQTWASKKNMAWPISPAGQKAFLEDLIGAVRQTPDHHGLGVIYWHPESIPLPGTTTRVWNGGAMSLFDERGNALPAVHLLR